MAIYSFGVPANLDGDTLRDELEAGGFGGPDLNFVVMGDELQVTVPDGTDEAAVGRVVTAHAGQNAKWREFYERARAGGGGTDPAATARIAQLEAAVDLLILNSLQGA